MDDPTDPPQPAQRAGLPAGMTPSLTGLMALAAGAGAATLYYNQPLIGVIAQAFQGQAHLAAFLPTASQVGYALGLIFLVPLGDGVDRRRLILVQAAALCVALAAAALAPGMVTLLTASVAIGICASLAQQIVPFAAELAAPAARGRVVGLVMSGLLSGILLARTVSGVVGENFGWRASFWVGGLLALLVLGLLAAFLPHSRPSVRLSYPRLMLSLATLVARQPVLRRATLTQAGLFGCFGAFWSVLALRLQGPPFHLGSDVAGLFGIVGAVGVMAAPIAGRMADRQGADRVILVSIGLVLVSFVIFAVWPSLIGLAVGVILLDLGIQAALISHQTIVYALDPPSRNRINTVFMAGMFIGGGAASLGAGFAWRWGGWDALCLFGVGLSLYSLVMHLTRPRPAARLRGG